MSNKIREQIGLVLHGAAYFNTDEDLSDVDGVLNEIADWLNNDYRVPDGIERHGVPDNIAKQLRDKQ